MLFVVMIFSQLRLPVHQMSFSVPTSAASVTAGAATKMTTAATAAMNQRSSAVSIDCRQIKHLLFIIVRIIS